MGRFDTAVPLASGGTAEVFKAFDPDLGRWVALKLLHHDDPLHVERLLLEARAQARVDHPHVCKIYEVGERDGRPFIAMQYIEGETLGDAAPNLTLEEKVRLIAQVADAVHAAHRVGLIHRDIKPGNVMVERDDEGELRPYVLDFGLAHDEINPGGLTVTGQVLGTAAYMSPEQARGAGRADRRTDVWGLGATLYEVLLGRPPFDGNSISETLIGILQKEVRPPRSLDPRFPRDLQTIVLKCLEKPPERRYVSARALASDLRRFLDGNAIEARPPTWAYRMQTLGRKNPMVLRVLAATLVVVLLGGIKYTIDVSAERSQAIAAQLAAEQAGQEAEEVIEFLVGLFQGTDPYGRRRDTETHGETITARELLDRGAERLERELEDRPGVRARLLDTIGVVYRHLALYDDAERLHEQALALQQEVLGEDHVDVAGTLAHLAAVYLPQGRYDDVEAFGRRALAIQERTPAADPDALARSLTVLGQVSRRRGHYQEAEALYERALEVYEQTLAPGDLDLAIGLDNLGEIYYDQARYAEAVPLHERALAIREGVLGLDHPALAYSLGALARVYSNRGRELEAEKLYSRALAIREQALTPDHPDIATSLNRLSIFLKGQGRYQEAEPLAARAVEIYEKALGRHPKLAVSLNLLAMVYARLGRYDGAQRLHERALDIREEVLGPEHRAVSESLNNLGWLLWQQSRYDEAEPYFRRALALKEKVGSGGRSLANTLTNLGLVAWKQGRLAEAEAILLRGLAIREQILGPDHVVIAESLWGIASVYRDQQRYLEAEPLYRRAIDIQERTFGPDHEELRTTQRDYDELLRATGRDPEL